MLELEWEAYGSGNRKPLLRATHNDRLIEIYTHHSGAKRYGYSVTKFENGYFTKTIEEQGFKTLAEARKAAEKLAERTQHFAEHVDKRFHLHRWAVNFPEHSRKVGKAEFRFEAHNLASSWDLEVKIGDVSCTFEVSADLYAACFKAAQIYNMLYSFDSLELERLSLLHKQVMTNAKDGWEKNSNFPDGLLTWYKLNGWSLALANYCHEWHVLHYGDGKFHKVAAYKTKLEAIDYIYGVVANPNPLDAPKPVLWASGCVGAQVMTGFSAKRNLLFKIYIGADKLFRVNVVISTIADSISDKFDTLEAAMKACDDLWMKQAQPTTL